MYSQNSLMKYPSAALASKVIFFVSLTSLVLFFLSAPYPSISEFAGSPSSSLAAHHKPRLSNLVGHGASKCLPALDDDFYADVAAWNASCQKFAPYPPASKRIATVSVSFGKRKETVTKALRTHMLHAAVNGEDYHVMCDSIVEDAMWNKQTFLLSVLLDQMLLPEDERYEWLFWSDSDTMILDYCRPTSSFVPPSHELEHVVDKLEKEAKEKREEHPDENGPDNIHLLATEDGNGFNAGIFFLRVHPWSVAFLEEVLAFPYFKPDEYLAFSEQTAMAKLMNTTEIARHIGWMPIGWFTGYPNAQWGADGFKHKEDQENIGSWQIRRGDFLIHFAGCADKVKTMGEWQNVTETMGNIWEEGRVQRDFSPAIAQYWNKQEYLHQKNSAGNVPP